MSLSKVSKFSVKIRKNLVHLRFYFIHMCVCLCNRQLRRTDCRRRDIRQMFRYYSLQLRNVRFLVEKKFEFEISTAIHRVRDEICRQCVASLHEYKRNYFLKYAVSPLLDIFFKFPRMEAQQYQNANKLNPPTGLIANRFGFESIYLSIRSAEAPRLLAIQT